MSSATKQPPREVRTPQRSTSQARRDQREKQANHRKKKVRTVLTSVVSVLLVVTLIAVGWTWWQYRSIARVNAELAASGIDEPQNFLIVGSDSRDLDPNGSDAGNIFGAGEPEGERADSIVVARIDPLTTSVEMLSIPRDFWVEDPQDAGEHHKINALYQDGPQSLIDSITNELDIPIHHYVEINFNGFKDLVDAIGGVPMYIDRPMYDKNSGLNITEAGCYTFDGVDALAYTRSRNLVWSDGVKWHTDGSADLGRITRQQVFMRRAAAKIAQLGLGDVNTLRVLVAVAVDHLTIDQSLSVKRMLGIAKQFDGFTAENMTVHRLPSTPDRTSGGTSILRLDKKAAADVLNIFSGDADTSEADVAPSPETTLVPIESSSVVVDVLNASGQKGFAADAADSLGVWGFTIGDVGNERTVSSNTIRYKVGSESAAHLVANLVEPKPELVVENSLADNEVQLILSDSSSVVTSLETASTPVADPREPAGGSDENVPDASLEEIGLAPGDPPPGVTCG